ncbi:MAG: indolepyruvate ferredoxin oxidoreductase family protein, partial [Zavarzinia sp.]|nr:indolepyruvate ferredoxin oxidoreductase family protein [Zavarzinia sp.]
DYEVARLVTDGDFARQIAETFEGEALRLRFHLAPPLLARRDPATGRPRKMTFGPWIMPAFRLLARLKGLRGTWADPFGRTAERRMERRLITDYQARVGDLLPQLRDDSYGTIVAIAALPERVRGFGPVKEAAIAAATAEGERLQARLAGSAAPFRKVGNGAGAAEYRPVDRV